MALNFVKSEEWNFLILKNELKLFEMKLHERQLSGFVHAKFLLKLQAPFLIVKFLGRVEKSIKIYIEIFW